MKQFFDPKSIAVIGASRKPNSVGQGIVRNLLEGGVFTSTYNQPFKGKVYLINPNAKKILGINCHPSILKVKENIDLAIIAVAAKLVLTVVKECIPKKVKGVIIISAGFAETGNKGKRIQEEITKLLKKAKIPFLGPNCLGVINTKKVNASFAPTTPPKGNIAFVSQSGAIADSVIDWAIEKNYGFSKIISVGNSASLDVSDFINYLSKDKDTKAIAIYLEALKDGRKFMKVAKSTKKPIIVLKGGKTKQGKSAITSHTGTIAGDYRIYKTAFKQSGVHLVETIKDLFENASLLTKMPKNIKNNIAIITNGGGVGVLTADHCEDLGIHLATLSKNTINKLNKKMHPAYSKSNPLDIVGDAVSERYKFALDTVLKQKNITGIIVLQTLQTMTEPVENAKTIVKAQKRFPKKPIIAVVMGGRYSRIGKHYLEVHKIPVYTYPIEAVKAMKTLIKN